MRASGVLTIAIPPGVMTIAQVLLPVPRPSIAWEGQMAPRSGEAWLGDLINLPNEL